eukprot:550959-Pelagomonas_calceolata.AAC.2
MHTENNNTIPQMLHPRPEKRTVKATHVEGAAEKKDWEGAEGKVEGGLEEVRGAREAGVRGAAEAAVDWAAAEEEGLRGLGLGKVVVMKGEPDRGAWVQEVEVKEAGAMVVQDLAVMVGEAQGTGEQGREIWLREHTKVLLVLSRVRDHEVLVDSRNLACMQSPFTLHALANFKESIEYRTTR